MNARDIAEHSMQTGTSQKKVVIVNGESTVTGAESLAGLIHQLGFDDDSVASALNGEFVPRHARAEARLGAGDHVEIVAPRQGG
jgi:sulfur carrier protein